MVYIVNISNIVRDICQGLNSWMRNLTDYWKNLFQLIVFFLMFSTYIVSVLRFHQALFFISIRKYWYLDFWDLEIRTEISKNIWIFYYSPLAHLVITGLSWSMYFISHLILCRKILFNAEFFIAQLDYNIIKIWRFKILTNRKSD